MHIALFCHSLRSDWNHGNAHFLRGLVVALQAGGHRVRVFEPHDGWSARQLAAEQGADALSGFARYYPGLSPHACDLDRLDLDDALDGVDLVLVHEWSPPRLVARLGAWRARTSRARLLFHDTHHRSVTRPEEIRAYDLSRYDGVLAFGEAVRQEYLRRGWVERAWTWHEAADVRVFAPKLRRSECDVVWIGNWGDEERAAELGEFLLDPVRRSGARGRVYGVRYPDKALDAMRDVGLEYRGWIPNYRVPDAFAAARVTVHVPRRAYASALPGIPTIRPFEAMACGIPLVSAPWSDVEGLFTAGLDYWIARTGTEMSRQLRVLLHDGAAAAELAAQGRATILARHTCTHRAAELIGIAGEIGIVDCPATPCMETAP